MRLQFLNFSTKKKKKKALKSVYVELCTAQTTPLPSARHGHRGQSCAAVAETGENGGLHLGEQASEI